MLSACKHIKLLHILLPICDSAAKNQYSFPKNCYNSANLVLDCELASQLVQFAREFFY